MTDQTESASEHAELLRVLEHGALPPARNQRLAIAAAIRALEAKVHRLEVTKAGLWEVSRKDFVTMSELRAERDRLDLECARLTLERDRLAGEVERTRQQYAALLDGHGTVMDARDRLDLEVARLTAELAAARENEARYLWLREGGFNLPDLPYKRQSGAESVEEIEAAIDADRRTAEDEGDE